MSDQSPPLVPLALLPPGVDDERQRAFVETLDAQLSTIDIASFKMSDAAKVDRRLLPYLVREFSLQEFIEPGLSDDIVRAFIARAHELHSMKGYVEGTRLGLSLLGVEIDWVQWWQENPHAAPNTHRVRAFFDDILFTDNVLADAKHRRQVTRIVHATQRWSQDIAITFGVRTAQRPRIGAVARMGGMVRHGNDVIEPKSTQAITPLIIDRVGGTVTHRSQAA